MTIPCNKNITKLKNNQIIRIIITLQCILQSTKYVLKNHASNHPNGIIYNKQQHLKKSYHHTPLMQWSLHKYKCL